MVSMKMIAEKCKVSVATVSKALSDREDIGEETKNRIRQVARELGYVPNIAARALKTNRSYNIGVLFEEEAGRGFTHEYFSGVLNGLKAQAERQQYDLTFINTSYKDRGMTYLDHVRYRNFDGVAVICCGNYEASQVQEVLQSDIPTVTVDYVHQNCTAVLSNNIKGMEELVKYIYSCGHRRIAYIHGQSGGYYVTRDRLASFYRTAEELGLNIPGEYVIEARYAETKGAAEATKTLLDLKEPPTCIIYPDDLALIGGRNVITERGMRIPNDISVAGYDGIHMSQLLHPKLTTIRQDSERIGEEAARRLIQSIETPKTALVERVVIDGGLLLGQSVGIVSPETQNHI